MIIDPTLAEEKSSSSCVTLSFSSRTEGVLSSMMGGEGLPPDRYFAFLTTCKTAAKSITNFVRVVLKAGLE